MQPYPIVMIILGTTLASMALANDDDWEMRQQQLDNACEAAREALIAPLRRQAVAECVDEKKDQAYCERFYRDYGERGASGRPALFYDIPECVKAFEHRKHKER